MGTDMRSLAATTNSCRQIEAEYRKRERKGKGEGQRVLGFSQLQDAVDFQCVSSTVLRQTLDSVTIIDRHRDSALVLVARVRVARSTNYGKQQLTTEEEEI